MYSAALQGFGFLGAFAALREIDFSLFSLCALCPLWQCFFLVPLREKSQLVGWPVGVIHTLLKAVKELVDKGMINRLK